MQKYDFKALASGAAFVVHSPGRYFKYLTGSAGGNDASITITPGGKPGSRITLYPGQAMTLPNDKGDPDSWTLVNALGQADISGTVIVGDGRVDDNTLQGVVQVVDGGKARTLAGSAFMGAVQSTGAAGHTGDCQLWNPAGSGIRAVVEQIMLQSGTTGACGIGTTLAAYATVNGGAAAKKIGGGTSVCQLNNQTNGAVGASQQFTVVGVTAGQTTVIKLNEPIVIPPGFGLSMWSPGLATSLWATFEFFEEPNV
ncbi:hypothetical protein [Paraburkholderia tropica]|uniref:hypothetical protein n=1 Tax=Paraburkholderia tropica TaxID=92647 RepID=UPI002ABE4AE6|nr:hypothetical protein [Paraburkholderia tropica]